MIDKRYYVYVAIAFEDIKTERARVENCLLNSGGFPWGFSERRTSLNTAQARRQIDECDYMVVVLGSKYGEISPSGISYTHLDFLYALNKQKTIIAFVDAYPEQRKEQETNGEIIRNMNSFRDMLKRDSRFYYEYKNILDLETAVRQVFYKAQQETPAKGWIRPHNYQSASVQEVDQLQKHIQQLEAELQKLKREKEQNIARERDKKPTPSPRPSPTTGTTTATAAPVKSEKNQPITELPTANSGVYKGGTVAIHYKAHAYQDGNLQDIKPTRQLSWVQILYILGPYFEEPTLESNFARALNHYLESTALPDARQFFPRAHAVARTQIDAQNLQEIKLQMKWNNWIIPQPHTENTNRVYWELTDDGRALLNELKKNLKSSSASYNI